jgi:ABC-type lipoprotein export system ATPase subunit
MIKLNNISKIYMNGSQINAGIKEITVNFSCGEFIAITGSSGSGKTTLLTFLPYMIVDNEETEYFDETDWQKYRKEKISFVHQDYNLIENYSVYQNIELAYIINNYYSKKERIKKKFLVLLEVFSCPNKPTRE